MSTNLLDPTGRQYQMYFMWSYYYARASCFTRWRTYCTQEVVLWLWRCQLDGLPPTPPPATLTKKENLPLKKFKLQIFRFELDGLPSSLPTPPPNIWETSHGELGTNFLRKLNNVIKTKNVTECVLKWAVLQSYKMLISYNKRNMAWYVCMWKRPQARNFFQMHTIYHVGNLYER